MRREAAGRVTKRIHVTVNGIEREVDVAESTTLLDFIRDDLKLTGTKECCDVGECGACTVLVEGRAVNSCLMLAAEVEGGEMTTIEGLSENGKLSRLQDAFLAKGAVQCGFCIPGQVMAAHQLLQRSPHPTLDEVKEGLSGNLCRCGGYVQICEAVVAAGEDS
jgi:aerobic carbon-monoxide dehydrogenase small subunit